MRPRAKQTRKLLGHVGGGGDYGDGGGHGDGSGEMQMTTMRNSEIIKSGQWKFSNKRLIKLLTCPRADDDDDDADAPL